MNLTKTNPKITTKIKQADPQMSAALLASDFGHVESKELGPIE